MKVEVTFFPKKCLKHDEPYVWRDSRKKCRSCERDFRLGNTDE